MNARAIVLKAISEKALMQQVLDLARMRGFLCYHTFDSRRSAPGFPDIIAIRDNRLVVVETKTERGQTTEAQERWLAAWRQVPGAEVYVVRPSDRDEIEEVLK